MAKVLAGAAFLLELYSILDTWFSRRNLEVTAILATAVSSPVVSRYGIEHVGNQFIHTQLWRDVVRSLVQDRIIPFGGQSIADIGCGEGQWLVEFLRLGAPPQRMAGIDMDATKTGIAAERLPRADIRTGSAAELPWATASFDFVSQFTLFTSIPDDSIRRRTAQEMLRVLKPSGAIFWYDFCFDSPSNKSVRRVTLEEIQGLFPDCDVRSRRVTLAPPVARRVAPVTWIGAAALELVPFLRTHRIAVIRRGQRSG